MSYLILFKKGIIYLELKIMIMILSRLVKNIKLNIIYLTCTFTIHLTCILAKVAEKVIGAARVSLVNTSARLQQEHHYAVHRVAIAVTP